MSNPKSIIIKDNESCLSISFFLFSPGQVEGKMLFNKNT